MKTIVSVLITLALAITLNSVSGQSTDEKTKEFEKQSMMLIQKLYSCQSMAHAIMSEQDHRVRIVYFNLGNKYYQDAYSAFVKMKAVDEDIDVKLRENLATLLQLYAKAFESIDSINKPETAIALAFAKQYLKNSSEGLFCKQPE